MIILVIFNQQFQGTIILMIFDLQGDGKVSIHHPLTRKPGNKVSQGAGSPMLNMPLWRVTHFPDRGRAGETCSKYHDHTVDGNAAPPGMYKTLKKNGINQPQLVQDFFHQQHHDHRMILRWLRFAAFNPDILEPVFTHKWQSSIWYGTVYKTTSWTRWDETKTVQRMRYSPVFCSRLPKLSYPNL